MNTCTYLNILFLPLICTNPLLFSYIPQNEKKFANLSGQMDLFRVLFARKHILDDMGIKVGLGDIGFWKPIRHF